VNPDYAGLLLNAHLFIIYTYGIQKTHLVRGSKITCICF
jgi:hypothetical protein